MFYKMQDFDFWCKIALGIICYAFVLIRISFIGYSKIHKTEIKRIEKGLDLIFLVLFLCYEVITYFLLLLTSKFTWSSYPHIPWISWLGVAIGIISLLLFIWVQLTLGRSSSLKIEIQELQELITKGPYNLVRHPMYTSLLILHIGVFLMTSNWFIGASWFASLILFLVFRIPKEEEALLDEFGELYQNYMNKKGRVFPKISVYAIEKKSKHKI